MARQNQEQGRGANQNRGRRDAGGMLQNVAQSNVAEGAAWVVGGALGAVAGSVLGPIGTVAGAVVGGALADEVVENAQASAPRTQQTGSMQAQSLRATLHQYTQMLDRSKEQLAAQMDQLPDPKQRTILQLAINAANNAVVQCHTAEGSL